MGGLSVLKQIQSTLPHESVIYYGDTAHVPYGGRPLHEVRDFALNICRFLASGGVKMIVMACNISSAVAIDEARKILPNIPILGVIEPGVAAALATGATNIGVLATLGTVSSGAYSRVIHRLSPNAAVTEEACPEFVPIVEAEKTETSEAFAESKTHLSPLADTKSAAIILGCTHYPFLLPALSAAAEKLFATDRQPIFIDPAIETANAIKTILSRTDLLNSSQNEGRTTYYVSGPTGQFEKNGSFFLGKQIESVEQAILS